MNNIKNIGFVIVFAALATASCGQEDIVWPFSDSGTDECSECDPLYPQGPYALEEGAVLPCFEWESARVNYTDTIIDIDAEYLSALNDADNNNRAVVIVVSAQNCGPCAALITEIASKAAELEQAGAFMMAAAYTDMSDGEVVLGLERAEEVLLEDDNWPVQWPLTNDEEKNLRALGGEFPQLVVVRMNDMMVYSTSFGRFGTNDFDSVDEFLATIQSFPDVTSAK